MLVRMSSFPYLWMAPGESVTARNDDRNWRLNWFRKDGLRSPMCGVSGMLGLSFVETLSTLMMTGLGVVGPFSSFVQAISSSGNSVLTSAIIVCAYSTKKRIDFNARHLSLSCHIVCFLNKTDSFVIQIFLSMCHWCVCFCIFANILHGLRFHGMIVSNKYY